MKILVTGGAGFIGSHLALKLIDDNHEVYIVDNLSTGDKENIPDKANFLNFDLASDEVFDYLPKDIEIVYHLASQASGEVSWDDPMNDLKANTLATLNLLMWSKKNKVNKFIFTSTMGVYRDNMGVAANEESPLCPNSFYGINKLTCENYIRIFCEDGLDCTIFRFFNVYGPGQNMNNLKQGMISIYMAYLNKKEPIVIKGPLNRSRDFVYINDVVNALVLGMKKTKSLKIYNVATNIETKVENIISILLKTFKETNDYPIRIEQRTPRDINNIYGNFELIERELGWRPKFKIEEGISLMYKWLKKI